jgi:5-(carboxyamino)imidazole ribonucleotide mutase
MAKAGIAGKTSGKGRSGTADKAKPGARPLVGVIMGSISDWETMKDAAGILKDFSIPFESKVVSAHRTPELMVEYAQAARDRGIEVIIAGAGGAAHLPG